MTDKLKKGQTNEPLKDKLKQQIYCHKCKSWEFHPSKCMESISHANSCSINYQTQDIKSAVEWLKEELKKHNDRPQYNKEWVIELINKAFEDVIK